ncbi:MAG: CO dehydrogenase/CO-methylating acetyl-CoA synthase complex subunit beta [Spirochaetaceae bacterium]|jgi:acetyl-CoA synthase|nr:CO dehydrogenase/CO-methylating acetyl-CoA synthase complex subunit beta [Spirochaetaceae bacterium]
MKKLLFNRVFDGADEMFAIAEKALAEALKKHGEGAQVKMPNTGYFLANCLAYLNKKVTTLGELKACFEEAKAEWMPRNQRLYDAFRRGKGTFIAGEVVEAIRYLDTPEPYGDGPNREFWGHMSDAEVRELGVPLVTGDIPGFVVIIGKAPSDEEAAELIKGYQSRAIFVFLIGECIQQARRMGLTLNFSVRVVPVGPDLWQIAHIISLVNRAAMIFGNTPPGDHLGFDDYTFKRIRAFVNAFAPVPDLEVAWGGGAIAMGFPVISNDTNDTWPVPKSLIIQENTKDFIETSLEARDIKIKVTKIDIPVAFSTAFEGEIIRRADMHCDIDGAKLDCFEWVTTKETSEIEDHKIEVIGPDIDTIKEGDRSQMGFVVEIAGKNMQKDFEPVFERRIHHYLNYAEGIMHTGQRDLIRIRVSKNAFAAGFRAKHFGEILYAKLKGDYDAIIDKCQVKVVTDPALLKTLRADANKAYEARDARLLSLTDESVEVFYTCILCQSFSPAHVCIVTPERLGLCGAVSWLDAKATNEIDPNGSCKVVTKKEPLDDVLGIWQDVNDAVQEASHGSLQQVTLYSIMTDPMTSCGCFECICGIEPTTNGVVIVNREHTGQTPLGMSFSEMASMTGGGVQTPGFMGHGKQFISSKKFMKAEGGPARIVWMPKALKELVGARLNKTAKELYNIDEFTSMIADEEVSQDPESLAAFASEKGHPALQLEPLM